MAAPLPPTFFLYFPNRHSQADPYSGFVLVNAIKEGTAWRIQPCEPAATTFTLTSMTLWDGASPSFTANVHHDVTAGLILNKTLIPYAIKIKGPNGADVRVLELYKHTTVFARHLKRNVSIVSTIAPAPAPKKQNPTTLTLHVARQLLELARLKRDQCPIIMEDLMEGHTAVMPCGHLFSQLAIEESFKKEANTCPACRQHGQPTLV